MSTAVPSTPKEWDHPGNILRAALDERGMSQADLARATGLTQKHISRIITGQAGVGQRAAASIGRVLGMSGRVLVQMQTDYDYAHGRNQR
jgi:addiction module HigA family antidote